MAGPGMSDETYKKLSRKGKIAYWVMIIVVAAWVAYVWLQ
jgi:hypothetical protein